MVSRNRKEKGYGDVLAAAFSAKTKTFFRRMYFHYFGPQLGGEYWFKGFRLAPCPVADDMTNFLFEERVLCIDQAVDAIDDVHSFTLASERANRYAARLSTILNVGIHQIKPARRLVIDISNPNNVFAKHMQTGYSDPGPIPNEMPKAGELAKSGEFSGSVWEAFTTAQSTMKVPADTRRIINQIDSLAPRLSDGFDRCSKLYQLSFALENISPSAALAYRVAALDALAQASDNNNFVDLSKRYLGNDPRGAEVIEELWGSGRSAHFHGGSFPLDADPWSMSAVMLPDAATLSSLRRFGYTIVRYVLFRWIAERIQIEPVPNDVFI